MSAADHALPGADLAFAPPLDLAASLAPLGRAGDDLIDRFDGSLALRTLALAPTEGPVAYAAQVTDGPDQPGLAIHVAADHVGVLPALTLAVGATLLTDVAALNDLADKLSDRFDTRVKVDIGRRKGKITIEFATVDDLERIVGIIGMEGRE